MFRQFVNQSLGVVIDLLLRTPPSMTEVHQCLGKFFGALITAIGPEYQGRKLALPFHECSDLIGEKLHYSNFLVA